MASTVSISVFQTIYRLGSLYSNYRVIVALSLTLIFLLTLESERYFYQFESLYFYALLLYVASSILQTLCLRYVPHAMSQQIIALFAIDLLFLNTLTFALGGPNIAIGLLFVISVFFANFLLSKNKALLITLIAVIGIVYQQFFGSLFSIDSFNNIGDSAFLAFLFFVVHGIGQISIQRFQVLESLNTYQANELFKLQNINRYILEQIEVGYLVLDENCKILVSNPAACSLLGISPFYTHEQFDLMNFHPDLYEMFKKTLLVDHDHFQFESEQSTYLIDVRVQKLVVPQQALTLLILEDAQKINQTVQKLKLAALGQLSASIAHEIRNPLAALVQANELNDESDHEQKLMLNKMIAKQATRIDKIIKDTLDMAKNKKTIGVPINFEHFIQDLISQDLADISSKIKLQLASNTYIYFDEMQLRQVLINLIRNAIRHNSPEHPYIYVRTSIHHHQIFIEVIDFGEGIQSQDLAQLFQPFFSTEMNGNGLGLYLSQSICEANQAKLSYVEKKHQGACFRITCHQLEVNMNTE